MGTVGIVKATRIGDITEIFSVEIDVLKTRTVINNLEGEFTFVSVSGTLYIGIGSHTDKILCPSCARKSYYSMFIGRSGRTYEVGGCESCNRCFFTEIGFRENLIPDSMKELIKADWEYDWDIDPRTVH